MEKKIVLVTGTSPGMGEGWACKFAMNGYLLILNGENVGKPAADNVYRGIRPYANQAAGTIASRKWMLFRNHKAV